MKRHFLNFYQWVRALFYLLRYFLGYVTLGERSDFMGHMGARRGRKGRE